MPTQVVFFILGGVAATTLGFSETFPSGAQLAVGMVGRLSMMAAVVSTHTHMLAYAFAHEH